MNYILKHQIIELYGNVVGIILQRSVPNPNQCPNEIRQQVTQKSLCRAKPKPRHNTPIEMDKYFLTQMYF
ncbi:unnamed protein product (macronuclear) [Paramecium tetraurelia]|uniref:Uncharacterized protein n=1 Tax=Paramecium tetraurelia TaxID=5888 RepID=A0E5I8_PARTE|nr:uncharacterized protein GSPATT00003416001 [Paramecium tetraurelia]CAK90555.1 unnamed protein product [Paramecium tetraurelia]|eukprot:XP_001457952.1 hypothetical protein (macronuclear) [Paramecium tetraurelia strain d4-2]